MSDVIYCDKCKVSHHPSDLCDPLMIGYQYDKKAKREAKIIEIAKLIFIHKAGNGGAGTLLEVKYAFNDAELFMAEAERRAGK